MKLLCLVLPWDAKLLKQGSLPSETRGQASLLMFRAHAASGMSPLEIIRAATINAADLLAYAESRFPWVFKER